MNKKNNLTPARSFIFLAGAYKRDLSGGAGVRGVNALLLVHDKIKGTKGNWARGRGRGSEMMKYEIFVSRDVAIYPSALQRR